jgi:hypothetical protein
MNEPAETASDDVRAEAFIDSEIIYLLCRSPHPWTVDEVVREFQNPDAAEGVSRLHGAGLLHRCGAFVFPTQTARRAQEIHELS